MCFSTVNYSNNGKMRIIMCPEILQNTSSKIPKSICRNNKT